MENEAKGLATAVAGARYCRARDVELRSIVGEPFLIVLHAGESKMFSLNGMGLWFWTQLEHPLGKPDLLERMLRDYEVDGDTAAHEIDRFLEYLQDKRLITCGMGS